MSRFRTIGAASLLVALLTGSVQAQNAPPITGRDVVGEWILNITPPPRRGSNATVAAEDRPDISLAVAARGGGALACVIEDEPADCRIDDGELVISWLIDGARMTFTLVDRASGGFVGRARLSARLLPFGSVNLGSVDMTRR